MQIVKKVTITACTICKNEERDLPGFIENLIDWVDEIILVDDGSTDRTAEIAKDAGDKVKFVTNVMGENRDFGKQRNISIEHASSDWLLHMDVDERVTPELAANILKKIQETDKNGFKYKRINHFLHYPVKGGGWHNWEKPQLGRRGKHYFKNKVHEECIIEGGEDKTDRLKGGMWHLIDASYEERLEKNIRYSKVVGENILKRVNKVRWYHLILHPTYRGLKSFFWQKGFLDGTRGLIFALYTFISTFNWWVFAWEKQNRISRSELDNMIKEKWRRFESPLKP